MTQWVATLAWFSGALFASSIVLGWIAWTIARHP